MADFFGGSRSDFEVGAGNRPNSVPIEDEISSLSLVSTANGSRVRVIPEGEKWPLKATKSILKKGYT